MLGSASHVGTASELRERLCAHEEAGAPQAGNNRHEDICTSMELFAREGFEEFKEREQKRA
jgi:hypothetical protein